MKYTRQSKWFIPCLLAAAVLAGPAIMSRADATDAAAGRLLREEGFALAREGKFEQALAKLTAADKQLEDQTVTDAIKLLQIYLQGRKAHDQQRLAEYHEAVQRVWRSILAMDEFPALAEAGIEEKLRTKVMEGIGDAQGNAGTAVQLERTETSDVPQLKKETDKALADAESALDESLKLLEQREGGYSETFRKMAEQYRKQLQGYRKAWQGIEAEDRKAVKAAADALRPIETELVEALGDLESMISTDAWRVMLGQARLARDLAPKDMDITVQDWFKTVTQRSLEVASEAKDDARWYDVLAAYAGLKELDPDNAEFEELESMARAHARVVRIYGRGDEESAEKVEERWKDYTEGIDARMVEDTIDSAARVYVTGIDFKELLNGSLDAVKILAETPQVWKTFDGLAEKDSREQFLARIERIREHYGKQDDVSYLHLQLAMNAVLQASDRSVKLPTSVLAREFTDGLLDKLDRFSSMIWPSEYTDFRKSTLGRFGGVGIQISKEAGQALRVVTPLYGSPAFEAGIKAGDYIIEVEGTSTKDHDLDKLVNMISGPVGTKVSLTIQRPGVIKPFEVKVERDEIRIKTVKGWRRTNARGDWEYRIDPADKIGYIRVTQFTGETHDDLVKVIQQLRRQGIESVILDLRFNPGGLLSQAQQVSNE
ncbi:MAG: S41 family peptidase, partial [Planctomycetota bacterium]